MKFNADREIGGKSGLGIGGVFSMDVEVKDSSEEKVLAHYEALWIFSSSFHRKLIIESDSSNAIVCVPPQSLGPWKYLFHLVKIFFSFLASSDMLACEKG